MEDEQELVCDLLNGAIFNDLNDPERRFQRHDILNIK